MCQSTNGKLSPVKNQLIELWKLNYGYFNSICQ